MSNGIDLEFSFAGRGTPARRQAGDPMRILVIGDFSASGHRGRTPAQPLADRRLPMIDVDNFEQVLARLAPRLELPLITDGETATATIDVRTLDAFHPDTLSQRLEPFQALRKLQARLRDPASFAAAAAELRKQHHVAAEPPALDEASADTQGSRLRDESDEDTVERLLGGQAGSSSGPGPESGGAPGGIDALIRSIVEPQIVAEPDAHLALYERALEEAMSEQMRALLHQPCFQALEALWLGVHALVTGLQTDEQIQIHLLDATRTELFADISAARDDLSRAGLYRLLVDREVYGPDSNPWSLIVCDFGFSAAAADITLLAGLGGIASRAGGPVLASADPALLGCSSLAETPDPAQWAVLSNDDQARWQALRQNPVAHWIGLALPRVLMRLPYGQGGEPIDSFEFEELTTPFDNSQFLWGSSAFACAKLIVAAFERSGWEMEPGDLLDVDDLPAFSYKRDGEAQLLPCAEIAMPERTAETILRRGIMPLLSYRNRNAARLMRFQSIAEPPSALAGSWRR